MLPGSLHSVSMMEPLESVNASGCDTHMHISESQVHPAFNSIVLPCITATGWCVDPLSLRQNFP